MKPIEEIREKYRRNVNHWADQEFEDNDIDNAMKEYAEQVIDEYERKLNEYDGSVLYSQITEEIKKELK